MRTIGPFCLLAHINFYLKRYFFIFTFLSTFYFHLTHATNIFEKTSKVLAEPDQERVYRLRWQNWKVFHNKRYRSSEENFRYNVWLSNIQKNDDHNARQAKGIEYYKKGVNKFLDHTAEELKLMLQPGISKAAYLESKEPVILSSGNVPNKMTWGMHGSFLPANDHIIYDNGWAFAASEAVQAQIHRLTGSRLRPSWKEVLDCAENPDNHFTAFDAFSYIKKYGVTLESLYPYKHQRKMRCKREEWVPRITIGDYKLLEPGNENNLKIAVALIGPIAVHIKVTANFFFYESGIFYDPDCANEEPLTNHAMLLVGYGTSPLGGGDYWIVQNNWGRHWGERGFAKIPRNSLMNCGIASAASYPVDVKIHF